MTPSPTNTPIPDADPPAPGGTRDAAVDTLARTLWGEARGEPVRGIEAVAAVIVNRVRLARARGGFWWGDNVVAVCRKPFQFSCWNADDPNRPKLLAVTEADAAFVVCLRIARRAVSGALPDPTGGCTHYHSRRVHPAWARDAVPRVEIGTHLFYDDVE